MYVLLAKQRTELNWKKCLYFGNKGSLFNLAHIVVVSPCSLKTSWLPRSKMKWLPRSWNDLLPFMDEPFNKLAPLLTNLHFGRQCVPGMFEQGLALSVLYLHHNSCDAFRYTRDSFTQHFCSFLQPETIKQKGCKHLTHIGEVRDIAEDKRTDNLFFSS